jgi:opacity protein-like surface antigen
MQSRLFCSVSSAAAAAPAAAAAAVTHPRDGWPKVGERCVWLP